MLEELHKYLEIVDYAETFAFQGKIWLRTTKGLIVLIRLLNV